MPPPDPPSLCSACGRDLRATLRACGCLGVVERWVGGERTALVGRRWRTAGGAEATTYFGRVHEAHGRSRVSFPQHVPAHYGALRGDLVYRLDDLPAFRDPVVDALGAALLGGAARRVLVLRGVREIEWSRRGRHRRMETARPGFDDVSVEVVGVVLPEDDRVLAALLDSAPPTELSVSGYRGEQAAVRQRTVARGPHDVLTLLRSAVPRDDVPERWLAENAAEKLARSSAERTGALLEESRRDEDRRELVTALTRRLRVGIRKALADRGATA